MNPDETMQARSDWLSALRNYLLFSAAGHLLWEILHTPLYTIWVDGTWGEIAFAIVHCTGGDLLIATSTLLLALFVTGSAGWPERRVRPVLLLAVVLGVSYTIFSEWLNIEVRGAWAYRDAMPVVPVLDAHKHRKRCACSNRCERPCHPEPALHQIAQDKGTTDCEDAARR